ncbi:sodium:solute symporter family transporter [Deinococcus cavernae]
MAASANLPVILFTLFWKKFNATGAIWASWAACCSPCC